MRKIAPIVFILLILLSISTILSYWMGKFDTENIITHYKQILDSEKMQTKIWKDSAGLWHQKTIVQDIKNAKAVKDLQSIDTRYRNLKNQFDGLRNSLGNLHSATFTGNESSYNFSSKITDSILSSNPDSSISTFKYEDPNGWYKCEGTITPSKKISISFNARDSVVTVIYWKRKWLFSRRKYFAEFKSFNPQTKIVYNHSLIIRKQKRL